jgi:hypothetical protein
MYVSTNAQHWLEILVDSPDRDGTPSKPWAISQPVSPSPDHFLIFLLLWQSQLTT